jgi:HprK-related kinase A
MEATINWFIWSYINRVLLVHAAVVEREGRAVIMAGPSGSGKSTLCTALLARGWRLLSDEIAMVHLGDGRLMPHPRPISLKNQAIEMTTRLLPDACLSRRFASVKGTVAFMRPPRSSIAAAGEGALPVAVVFPRYRADAGFELTPIDRAPAFMRLIDCSANYLTLLEIGFDTLADLVEACDHYALDYASLDDAVGAIEQVGERARGRRKVA